MTIQSCSPLFFISYHQLLLEFLPLHFVQFRNIILGSCVGENSEDYSPPVGFDFKDTLKAKAVIQVIDSILQKKEKDREKVKSSAAFLTSLFKRAMLENNSNNIVYQSQRVELLNINQNSQSDNTNSTTNSSTSSSNCNNIFIPRIIWQFVFYCVKKSADMNAVIPSTNSDDLPTSSSFVNLPIVSLFAAILDSTESCNETSITTLVESIVDQLRYPNKHTTFASCLLFALFQKEDKNNRELILVSLIKRLTCVTSPPQSVRKLYHNIMKKFGNEVKQMFEDNNESNVFKMVQEIID